MIDLSTLGTLDILDRTDGHQILSVLAQPKRVGFLAYLAIASPRGLHQRDTLLGIFWPDSTDKKARNALNQTVFVLRRALGQELFIMNGEPGVGVDPDRLQCDVWEFEAALTAGEKEEALDLYKGNFLQGFFLPGCLEFERWVDSERSRLRGLATGAVLSLSHEMESAGNPVGAVGWLRRAREWAAYDEMVLCRLVELLLALGDRSGAVREYESFARRLAVDLGLEPSKETQELLRGSGGAGSTWRGSAHSGETKRIPLLPHSGSGSGPGRRFSLPQAVAMACLAGVIGVGGAVWVPRMWTAAPTAAAPSLEQKRVTRNVVVIPLENATGDPTLDDLGKTVADEIMQELATTGLASVGPGVALGKALGGPGGEAGSLGLTEGGRWTLKDAEYVVTGSYSHRDGGLAYQTRILHVESGSIVVAIGQVLGSLTEFAEATDRLKRRVAGALAMALDPRMSDLTLVASHPPSFEGYQLLSDGKDILRRLSTENLNEKRAAMRDSAVSALLQAASLDSEFTLPLIMILETGVAAEPESRFQAFQTLRARRADLPRWERANLDFHLAGEAFDNAGQYDAMLRIVRMAPSPTRILRLARAAAQMNRPREALRLLTEIESEQDWLKTASYYWMYVVDARLSLGDYEGVLADINRARAFSGPSLGGRKVEALARLGRSDEATSLAIELIESSGQPGTRHIRYYLPRVLRAVGLEDQARRVAEVGFASFSRIEGARPEYLAATLVCAGRFEEARQVLAHPEDLTTGRVEAFSLLAYMASREGNPPEAIRLSELAATAFDPTGETRSPYGIMSQVEVAAHLGDNAGAVRFLREAFETGLPRGPYLFTRWDLRPLQGYQPFEDLIRPKG